MQGFPRVYPITDPRPHAGHFEQVEAFLAGGARLIQIRDKMSSDADLAPELTRCLEACRRFQATLILNDRVSLAAAVGVDGVHVGQTDLPTKEARRILGPTATIGVSTHNEQEFGRALEEPVDYVAIGPAFETSSKPDHKPVLEPTLLRRLARISTRPVVAIGGINLDRACQIWEIGVSCVAVISDIVDSKQPARRVAEYLDHAERIRV